MKDLIAGIVTVENVGQTLDSAQGLALEEALYRVLGAIRRQESMEGADAYLTQLGRLQTELARACFKWEMQLPPKLRRLVREYDRCDDSDLRLAVFEKIKEGTFLL